MFTSDCFGATFTSENNFLIPQKRIIRRKQALHTSISVMVRSLSYGSLQIINIPLIVLRVLSLYVYVKLSNCWATLFLQLFIIGGSSLYILVHNVQKSCLNSQICNFALQRNFKLLNLTTQKHTGNTLVI